MGRKWKATLKSSLSTEPPLKQHQPKPKNAPHEHEEEVEEEVEEEEEEEEDGDGKDQQQQAKTKSQRFWNRWARTMSSTFSMNMKERIRKVVDEDPEH